MDYILVALLGWLNLVSDLPQVTDLDSYFAPGITVVEDQQGDNLLYLFRENREAVTYEQMPRLIVDAVTSAEDKRFWEHDGVDIVAFSRAMIQNVARANSGSRLLGASTITQQLAKRRYTDSSRTVRRKAREALLALRIEEELSKERIIEMYLNDLYFGRGAYGIKRAAQVYFDKPLSDLSIEEAAFLAALPKAPSTFGDPDKKARAKERRDWIIDQMVDNGYVSRLKAVRAKLAPLDYKPYVRDALLQERIAKNYFEDQVKRELVDHFGPNLVFEGRLKVVATIDHDLQAKSEKVFRQFLEKYDRERGWRGAVDHVDLDQDRWRVRLHTLPPIASQEQVSYAVVLSAGKSYAEIQLADTSRGRIAVKTLAWTRPGRSTYSTSQVFKKGDIIKVIPLDPDELPHSKRLFLLFQEPELNGGLVIMQPTTGHIKALVGGYDYKSSNFNRASQALRQPGSAFKPIVYLAALNNGYGPNSYLDDKPVTFPLTGGRSWSPKNYDGSYSGRIALGPALYRSRNIPAVNLVNQLGVTRVRNYAGYLGLTENQPKNLSIGLGAGLVSLVDMVGAYAMIANGGEPVLPSTLDHVVDSQGLRILDTGQRRCTQCISTSPLRKRERYWRNKDEIPISKTSVNALRRIMQDVVQRGTAQRIQGDVLGLPVAGKTGTTNDNKDAWFVGFYGDMVVGVYVGYDTPRSIGRSATGGAIAAPIFASVFSEGWELHKKWPDRQRFTKADFAEATQNYPYVARVRSASGAAIYAQRSRSSSLVSSAPQGAQLLSGPCGGGWCPVLFNGTEGYARSGSLTRVSSSPEASQVENALSALVLDPVVPVSTAPVSAPAREVRSTPQVRSSTRTTNGQATTRRSQPQPAARTPSQRGGGFYNRRGEKVFN